VRVVLMDAAHWIYVAGVATLIVFMALRVNVVIPALIAAVATTWVYTGSMLDGIAAPFNGAMVATTELLAIFVILAVVTAMTGAMRSTGSDKLMVAPLTRFMRNGHISFAVLFLASYGMSLIFWPTPTLALLAAILIPAAVASGLTRLGAAMAVALSGQGMALASDYVIGVAPSLTATGNDLDAAVIADRALVLSWIVGAVAAAVAFFVTGRGRMIVAADSRELLTTSAQVAESVSTASTSRHPERIDMDDVIRTTEHESVRPARPVSRNRSILIAALVPATFLFVVALLVAARFLPGAPELDDGAGAGLVGGTGLILLVVICLLSDRAPLEGVAEHFVDGLVFAFKTMGPIIPVAGFVLMGVGDFSQQIMGLPEGADAPAFLFDTIRSGQDSVPQTGVAVALAMMLAGMLVGLDGSGWAGLPLIGSLSVALSSGTGMAPETLAAIGQNGASWTGGGTLLVWSSLVAVAGVTGIPVIELARRLFVPVVSGLVVAALVAVVIF
jgi:hypothetical protein